MPKVPTIPRRISFDWAGGLGGGGGGWMGWFPRAGARGLQPWGRTGPGRKNVET